MVKFLITDQPELSHLEALKFIKNELLQIVHDVKNSSYQEVRFIRKKVSNIKSSSHYHPPEVVELLAQTKSLLENLSRAKPDLCSKVEFLNSICSSTLDQSQLPAVWTDNVPAEPVGETNEEKLQKYRRWAIELQTELEKLE